MQDTNITELLAGMGFAGNAANRVREQLDQAGLTNRNKANVRNDKVPKVRKFLTENFVRHCHREACQPAPYDQRESVIVTGKDMEHCETCGGSVGASAVRDMLEAMKQARPRVQKLFVIGGSKPLHKVFEQLCKGAVEVKYVSVDANATGKSVIEKYNWADLTINWLQGIGHSKTKVLQGRPNYLIVYGNVETLAKKVIAHCAKRVRN